MAPGSNRRPAGPELPSGRGLFLAFFVGGGIAILSMKSLSDSPILAVVLPILLMGSYALLLVEWPGLRPRYEFAGDNLYYLGFLYTLISLAISLYRFNTDGATSAIVTNFGLALTSTILGLAGRILLNQPQDEAAIGAETRPREDLARANRRLRAEMEYSIEEFQQFRAEAKRVFQQVDRGVSAAGTALEGQIEQLEGSAARFGALRERIAEVDASAAAAVGDIQAQRELFVSEAQGVSDSLRQMLEHFRSVDFRREFMEELIEPTSDQFQGLAREFLSVAEGLRRAESNQARILERTGKAVAGLAEMVEENRAVSEATAEAATGFREATASLALLRREIDRYLKETRGAIGELEAARRRAAAAAPDARSYRGQGWSPW